MSTPSFVKTVRPLLTREEELDLFARWRVARDTGSRRLENQLFQQIVIQFSPITKKIVKKMNGYGLDQDEMMNEALLALTRAVIDFDPSLGFRFGTYAGSCVLTTLYTYVTKNYFITNVCANSKNKRVFFRLRRIMAEHVRLSGQISITGEMCETLAEQLGVDVDTIHSMSVLLREPYSSLNQLVSDGSDTGDGLTQQDLLMSDDLHQEEQLAGKEINLIHHELIHNALATLDDRTRGIVEEQVLRPEGSRVTLEELGERYSISKERARQIREIGLAKIKKYISQELDERMLTPAEILTMD